MSPPILSCMALVQKQLRTQHGNREIDKCDKRKMEASQMDGGGEIKEVCVCDGVQMAPTAKEKQ